MFYRVANLAIEKVCKIKNFEESNFSAFKQLVANLKINTQKYNWPQKTCKPLNNTFPGSNWSVIVIRSEQSEAYDQVWVTKFYVFLSRRGTVTNLWFFGGLKKRFKKKNPTTSLCYLWEEYEKFWFFIMCHTWRYVSGHSLLRSLLSTMANHLFLHCWTLIPLHYCFRSLV